MYHTFFLILKKTKSLPVFEKGNRFLKNETNPLAKKKIINSNLAIPLFISVGTSEFLFTNRRQIAVAIHCSV